MKEEVEAKKERLSGVSGKAGVGDGLHESDTPRSPMLIGIRLGARPFYRIQSAMA